MLEFEVEIELNLGVTQRDAPSEVIQINSEVKGSEEIVRVASSMNQN